jgi:hypothetical protein
MNKRICPECGSNKLSLTLDHEVMGRIPDGRLKSNEIRAMIVVGCDECSATVEIVYDTDRLILLPPHEECICTQNDFDNGEPAANCHAH